MAHGIEALAGGAAGAATAAVCAIGINEALNSPRIQNPTDEEKVFPPPPQLDVVMTGGAVVGAVLAETAPRVLRGAIVGALAATAVVKLNRVLRNPNS